MYSAYLEKVYFACLVIIEFHIYNNHFQLRISLILFLNDATRPCSNILLDLRIINHYFVTHRNNFYHSKLMYRSSVAQYHSR